MPLQSKSMNLKPVHLILAIFFIIIIYLATYFFRLDEHPYEALVIITICGVVFMGMIMNDNIEHLYMPAGVLATSNVVDSDGELNINEDDLDISGYGNVSESGDIDMMDQRMHSMNFGLTSEYPEGKFDNSAAMEEALWRGNVVFQPNAVGISTTNNAALTNFSLGEPGVMSDYDIPLNPASTTMDETLARKQQQRASINKRAIDGAVRSTKNMFQKYFANELDENEKRVWWSDEAQELTTDFDPGF